MIGSLLACIACKADQTTSGQSQSQPPAPSASTVMRSKEPSAERQDLKSWLLTTLPGTGLRWSKPANAGERGQGNAADSLSNRKVTLANGVEVKSEHNASEKMTVHALRPGNELDRWQLMAEIDAVLGAGAPVLGPLATPGLRYLVAGQRVLLMPWHDNSVKIVVGAWSELAKETNKPLTLNQCELVGCKFFAAMDAILRGSTDASLKTGSLDTEYGAVHWLRHERGISVESLQDGDPSSVFIALAAIWSETTPVRYQGYPATRYKTGVGTAFASWDGANLKIEIAQ